MEQTLRANITHVIVLGVLLIALLAVLIFTGILSCNVVPMGCDIYYQALKGGQPVILIAYASPLPGEYGGLGDEKKLEAILNDRSILNAQIRTMEIERISYGNINDYDLIVVTHAKKICSSKLRVFESFVNNGGRLIWTGDAGTQLCKGDLEGERYEQFDEYLLEKERFESGSGKIIGPWARKEFGKQLSFDNLLGVQYKGNYCEFSECRPGENAGFIESVDTGHKLVYGISPSLPFSGDFAIVELNRESTVRLVGVLDYTTDFLGVATTQEWLVKDEKYNFGRRLPFIVSSQLGERVAYYAAPLETIYDQEQPYKGIIEQAYYGMLYK